MSGATSDVWVAMSTARTIRRFTHEPVDDATLARCLEAATWAPSGANAQAWRFIVLRSPEQRAGPSAPARRGCQRRPLGRAGQPSPSAREEVTVKLDLLTPGIEVGVVTTNLDEMVAFYEGFLGLEPQGEVDFEGGSQRRYSLGSSVLKLVTYSPPPPTPAAPGGGRAQAGVRYFTVGVKNLRELAEAIEASEYEAVEPLTEFAPVPGMGWMFLADPDGNWIELFGTL